MRSKPGIAALIFLVPIFMAFNGTGEKIVLIQSGHTSNFELLRDYQIKAVFKGQNWILASARTDGLFPVEKAGFDVTIVDDSPWSESYYFVSTPERGFPPVIPPSFRILANMPEGIVLEGPDTAARELYESNLWVMNIEDREIPLVEKTSGRFMGLSNHREDPLSSLTVQVSDSALIEYVTRLADFRTRLCCTDSNTAAAQWIFDKFQEFGYTVVWNEPFPFPAPGYPCDVQTNVIAVKQGSISPEKIIVIGGHYDSITYSPQICTPDTLAPGADDNASGTVTVLEAARLLYNVSTDVTIWFVAFGAEEQGLFGSTALARLMYDQGREVKLMINVDMVGNYLQNSWDFEIWATSPSHPFADIFDEIAVTYTDLIPHPINAALADAGPFGQLDFFNVGLAEWDLFSNPQWHSCSDEVDSLSIPYLAAVVETATRSLLYVSNIPMAPEGLTAVNVGDGSSLSLTWDPNEESDVVGYNIHYGTQPGVYDSLKTVNFTADTLMNLSEGTAFYLALTALDGDGNESFLTAEVEIVTSAVPAPPMNLGSIPYENRIRLTWEPNTGELDISGYNIYRFNREGTPDTSLVATFPHPVYFFNDTSVEIHTLYVYYLTAFDTEAPPNESVPSEECISKLASHDLGIMIIDNTADGSGGPFAPTDEDVDSYYDNLFSHYGVNAHWDVAESTEVSRPVMDYDAGVYSTIMWHCDVRAGLAAAVDTLVMKNYIKGGGKLWLSGWNILQSLTGSTGAHYSFVPGDFFNTYIGIDSALSTSSSERDFIGARPIETGFSSVLVDTGKTFPIYAMYAMDVFLPPFHGTFPIFSYLSSDSLNSPYHGLPVAVTDDLDDGSFVFTAFPLYFMETENVRSLVEAVMELFLEPASVEPVDVATMPRVYSLAQNYPNPFNPTTSINYEIPDRIDENVKVQIKIFNIRGKLVKTLKDGYNKPGSYIISWDGSDERGNTVSSGVYFYRIKAGDFSSTRKMILTR